MRNTILALAPLVWSLLSSTVLAGAPPVEPLAQTSPEPSPASPAVLELLPVEAGEQLITFSEYPAETRVSNQYVSKGISFGGDNPFITSDRSNPTSPVLAGTPKFFGVIEGRFVRPGEENELAAVNNFSIDIGYFDRAQSVRVSLFDNQGRLIRRASNAQLGVRTFTFQELGVHRWRVEAFSEEPNGFAVDNVRFPQPYRAIFAGIFGAGKKVEINDDSDRVVSSWTNEDIAILVQNNVAFCRTGNCQPRTEEHLKKIGASNIGGVTAIGFFMSSIAGASSVQTPGNSEVSKNFIVNNYKPGEKVYVVGFSAGGGDAQNVLEKLDRLNIPVQVSGHIDSVELVGDDASIPDNTRLAKGYYQVQSPSIVRGEDELEADDEDVTTVTNTKISNPVGPEDAKKDKYAHHRNMDNDPRVWNTLRTAITASLKQAAAVAADQPIDARCPRCKEITSSRSVAEWGATLETALRSQASGDELYYLRERIAQAVKEGRVYRELVAEHEKANGNATLQENLTAIFLKVNPSGFLAETEEAASITTDYPLFTAMLHSLARVEGRQGKKAVIRLIGNNRLDVSPGKVIDAAVSAYSNGAVARAEAGWMLEWVRTTPLSDHQLYAVARIMANSARQPEVRPLLDEVQERIQDERLKTRVEAIERN